MIDPSKLKEGQRIEFKQNQKGEWQEWLIDKDNNVVDVETVKPFEKSKEVKPNNYDELKKNYVYSSPAEKKIDNSLKLDDDLEIGDIDIDICKEPERETEIEEVRECGGDGELGDPENKKEEEEEIDIKEENHDNEEEH